MKCNTCRRVALRVSPEYRKPVLTRGILYVPPEMETTAKKIIRFIVKGTIKRYNVIDKLLIEYQKQIMSRNPIGIDK